MRGWSDFWFFSEEYLSELFARFLQAFPAEDGAYVHGAENVFEWFEGETADGKLGFNLSRPHIDLDGFGETAPDPDAPIRVRLYIDEHTPTADELGQRLANLYGLDIHTGEVDYLGGDEFTYRVSQTFRPNSR